LKQVLAFKKKIEDEKRYLFKQYETLEEFIHTLDGHLAGWLKDHDRPSSGLSVGDPTTTTSAAGKSTITAPGFDYWIAEAIKNEKADPASSLFCASKAVDVAISDIEWAKAKNAWGVAQFNLGKPDESISAFKEIEVRFLASFDADRRFWRSKALFNRGVSLGALGRHDDALAALDNLLARFGAATEAPLREIVAEALFNKGVALGELGRGVEAIALYDDLIARFGAATETPPRKQVAKALVNKGVVLGKLGRSDEEIAVYDEVIARFAAASEAALREQLANALVNKGIALGMLGRSDEAITVYDNVIARFGTATEAPLRGPVDKAQRLKAALSR
ncbi:MAG: tetratricopeptide repeat protein, partial [Methylocystis sp.]